jgi:cell wall-associated NlpC family hydrolase
VIVGHAIHDMRDMILYEARTWIGTPFHPGGRAKGVGVDCIGVVVGTMQALGLPIQDVVAYPMRPNGVLRRELNRQFDRVREAQLGDVLMMSFEREPHHVAFLAGASIIHCYAQVRRCVEQPYTDYWRDKVRGTYRLRGISDG